MKQLFRKLSSNVRELAVTPNMTVLLSYGTPVAVYLANSGTALQTSKFWSVTTSKHIRYWLNDTPTTLVPQESIDGLAGV